MTQYRNAVQKHLLLLEAEEWANSPKAIHTHATSSMWYDTRPEDTADGHVTDIEYNSGLVVRSKNDKIIHTFGERLTGDALIDSYRKSNVR
tara:strand:+ start:118 stop:390 length:273 start_codon:yes stop_codon:yes gene_type:complete